MQKLWPAFIHLNIEILLYFNHFENHKHTYKYASMLMHALFHTYMHIGNHMYMCICVNVAIFNHKLTERLNQKCFHQCWQLSLLDCYIEVFTSHLTTSKLEYYVKVPHHCCQLTKLDCYVEASSTTNST